MLWTIGKWAASILTGGSLQKILDIIDSKMDNDTQREALKVDVTKTWINAQANLLVGRTWWFQLFFVLPLGLWWTSVVLDSIFLTKMFNHVTYALPEPLNTWAGWIISALFIVDGSKAVIGRFTK